MSDTPILGRVVDDISQTIERLEARICRQTEQISSLQEALEAQGALADRLQDQLGSISRQLSELTAQLD